MTTELRKSLVTKLCEVMEAIDRVPKNGWNDFHKYRFAQEADIVEVVRKELAQRKVFIFPSITAHDRKEHTNDKGNKSYLTDITVAWTFCDGESEEKITVSIPGCGEDKSDKGFYKAFTGSEKYMLTKSFLIPTGDDPEREEGQPSGPSTRAQAEGPQPDKMPHPPQKQPEVVILDQTVPQDGIQKRGVLSDVQAWANGEGWSMKIGDFGGKDAERIWTKDGQLALSLVKTQGKEIVAHLRSKKAGSYQLISYVPGGDK